MSIFKKHKKKKEEFIYIDPDLDIEAVFRKNKISDRNDSDFREIEDMQYINTQCQLMTESDGYIEKIKGEYKELGRQMADISSIESAPDSVREDITKNASKILELREKRKSMFREKSRLTKVQSDTMERYADDFPQALVNLQNDEKYCSAVKHDMKMLEAEKASLKEDITNYGLRRGNIRNISVISLIAIAIVFIIFFASGQMESEHGMLLFMIVLTMTAILVFLIFFLQRNTLYRLKLAERKLERAVNLLNKTKIKYVNIANSVRYQRTKYHVKNSYDMGRIYETYLDEKKKAEKYKTSESALGDAMYNLDETLKGLNLFDVDFWNARADILSDKKAMEAFKKDIKKKREKMMDQIDYNKGRIEDARENIMKFVDDHPDQADKVMKVLDSFGHTEKTVDI